MAANYWTSTQRHYWQFSKEILSEIRNKTEDEDRNLVQQYPLPDRRLYSIFFNQLLTKLGDRLTIRQQALATAQVYVRRFYSKVEIRRTNPYLVLATALYLACKMEECPQHIRVVVNEACKNWRGFETKLHRNLPSLTLNTDFNISDVSKVGECEFYLISEMNSQLIVHHPYRTLQDLQTVLNLAPDDISLAWSIINDHYLTDLPLLYPPHVIAVTAIFLALTLKPTQAGLQAAASTVAALAGESPLTKGASGTATSLVNSTQMKIQNMISWLAEGEVDIIAVVDCSQEIISLYEVWEQYNDQSCKDQIARFINARGLDK